MEGKKTKAKRAPAQPVVVEFNPDDAPPPKPRKQKNTVPQKKTPKQRKEKEEVVLTAKEFVKKYQKEAVTASWDPKDLRKCGKAAKEILTTLGCSFKNDNIPFKVLQQRRQHKINKGELPSRKF